MLPEPCDTVTMSWSWLTAKPAVGIKVGIIKFGS
jgi:hypothetical protein